MSTNNSSSGSIGFAGLLTIVFIILKLTHVIDWSWVWVLAPAWISACLGIIIVAIIFLLMVISDKKYKAKRLSMSKMKGRING